MRKLIDINDGAMIERGIFPSLAVNQKELWRSASNVEFNSLRAKKATGYTVEANTGTVYAIAQAFVDTNRRAYWAEASDLYMYQAGNVFHIGGGYSISGFWSLETWGTWLLATNEDDPPQVWKNTLVPAVAAVPLGGLTGVRADRKYRILKKHKNHIVAYYGQTAEWCSESDPETWEPDVTNSAGGLFIRDLDSDIIAVAALGPDVAIYSGDSMVIQRYVGEPFYFGFETAIEGIGAVSEYAVASVGNLNYGMSNKGFFKTDGISYDYIDNPQINTWVKERFYEPQGRRALALHDEENDTVKWFFLGENGMIYGVGFHLKKETWTILNQPVTAAGSKQVFDTAIIGTRTSIGFLQGNDNGAVTMESSLTTFPGDAGNRDNYKLWDNCKVNWEGTGLEIRFGFQVDTDDAIDWSDWEPLARDNWINRESVFLTIDFRSTEEDTAWAITGFVVYGEVTGGI